MDLHLRWMGLQLLAGSLGQGQDPGGFPLKTFTCLVFALLLQLRESEDSLGTGSLGLTLIYVYLENLSARCVASSWKKHWGLNCLQAQ